MQERDVCAKVFRFIFVVFSPMQKSIFIPLIAITAIAGCSDQDAVSSTSQSNANESQAVQTQPEWVGQYNGTTPCMGCIARCEDCPGMSVDLKLNANQNFTLTRISLSGHNEVETIQGKFKFTDDQQKIIALENVETRNLILLDLQNKVLEIREDKSGKAYFEYQDFSLAKLS